MATKPVCKRGRSIELGRYKETGENEGTAVNAHSLNEIGKKKKEDKSLDLSVFCSEKRR